MTEKGIVKGNWVALATDVFTLALHLGFEVTGFLVQGRSLTAALNPSVKASAKAAFLARSNSSNAFITRCYQIIAWAPGDYPGLWRW